MGLRGCAPQEPTRQLLRKTNMCDGHGRQSPGPVRRLKEDSDTYAYVLWQPGRPNWRRLDS